MTPLMQRIEAAGTVTVESFMDLALLDPDHGYYTGRDPFGAAGDFVTAPEISQTFGELIGLWCFLQWQAAGAPTPAILAELGPGRGTLMADALRAIESATHIRQPFDICLVEASEKLARLQKQTLHGRTIRWCSGVEDLPRDVPAFVIANEFLDALPVRQFVRTDRGWRERRVMARDGRLMFTLEEETVSDGSAAGLPDAPLGRVAEVSPVRKRLIGTLAARLAAWGGAVLVIDFTADGLPVNDTLQAVRHHRYADRLATPGQADLAAAVDFDAVARTAAAAGVSVFGPVTQGAFLGALGIAERARILKRSVSPGKARDIDLEVYRLTSPEGMGEDFRVLAMLPASASRAEGFAQ